jgi:flagellar biosynthetic protein FliP
MHLRLHCRISPESQLSYRWMMTIACFFILAFATLRETDAQTTSSVTVAPTDASSASPAGVSPITLRGGNGMLGDLAGDPEQWTSREGLTSSIRIMLLLTVLSLAPAVLLMTTSFVRIIVVLGLLRQAMGTQQLPPSQVMTSLAMFMTLLIMTPVWKQVYDDSIEPYTEPGSEMSMDDAWEKGITPIRDFMIRQIQFAENGEDIWLFYEHMGDAIEPPTTYRDVPLQVLLPAYMLSELKVAFLIGFNIYLPFLILDIVVASITISMGMLMLPPVIISLPFKLLLFVLVDGWRLVVGMLLESFAVAT